MDIQMKPVSGLEAAEEILQIDPQAKILFLTTFSDDAYIIKALDLGAKGYILKQDFEGILPALFAVQQGQSVFGGEIVSKLPVLMQPKMSLITASMTSGKRNRKLSLWLERERATGRLQRNYFE